MSNFISNLVILVFGVSLAILIIAMSAQQNYYQRDLREQEEVYTTEIKRLIEKCKDNKISIQAPEYKPNSKGGLSK
mgnify:CR=1 FL=1